MLTSQLELKNICTRNKWETYEVELARHRQVRLELVGDARRLDDLGVVPLDRRFDRLCSHDLHNNKQVENKEIIYESAA